MARLKRQFFGVFGVLGVSAATLSGAWAAAPAAMDMHQHCEAGKTVLPPGLEGWATPVDMTAAATVAGLDAAVLTPGKAARVTLRRTPEMAYALRPAEPGGKVSSGGMLAFDAPVAGTYRVMLNVRAWLDVVRAGKPLDSVHHQHGPACSGIGKTVDFVFPAGRTVIQLSGSGKPVSEVMVVPVP